jgi:hypothetical protein
MLRLTLLLLTLTTALSSTGRVDAQERRDFVGLEPGQSEAIVWRSEASWDRGAALLKEGRKDLAERHIACRVPGDTRAKLLGGYSHATHRVLILEGPNTGCEGNVKVLRSDR